MPASPPPNSTHRSQVDALELAGCNRVFTETASGARTDRPALEQLLDQLRPGDTLVVVWAAHGGGDRHDLGVGRASIYRHLIGSNG